MSKEAYGGVNNDDGGSLIMKKAFPEGWILPENDGIRGVDDQD